MASHMRPRSRSSENHKIDSWHSQCQRINRNRINIGNIKFRLANNPWVKSKESASYVRMIKIVANIFLPSSVSLLTHCFKQLSSIAVDILLIVLFNNVCYYRRFASSREFGP